MRIKINLTINKMHKMVWQWKNKYVVWFVTLWNMGTKKFPFVTFPKNYSLKNLHKWCHTTSFISDVMTSCWWSRNVKCMSNIIIRCRPISVSKHAIFLKNFFVSNVLWDRKFIPPTSISVTLTGQGWPWNSRSQDFAHDNTYFSFYKCYSNEFCFCF